MKFIKKHKILLSFLVIFIILIIAGIIIIRGILYPNNGKTKYGDRLDGIEKYPISDEVINNIKKDLTGLDIVEEVNYHLQGRIVNITIKVVDGTDLSLAKQNANTVLNYFDDSYKSYYDFQIFLISETMEDVYAEDGSLVSRSVYPVIGYKHKNSSGLVWTVE